MTIPGFTVFTDPNGDLYVVDGIVAQLKTGVRLSVGSGLGFSPISPSLPAGDFVPVSSAISATFVGGSGRNLVATGLAIPLSGAIPPVGLFIPGRPDFFNFGAFTIGVAGASSATMTDDTDIVAELTSGGTAPVGNYAATAYGKTTYNGGADFTIAVALEIAGGGAIPDHLWTVNAGTAPGGTFTADDSANFTDSSDTDWTIVVNADGTADLIYDGTTMASRSGGSNLAPDGPFTATQDGMDAYNDGEPWTAFVTVSPRPPRAGFVYVKITESAGVLTNTEGPYFATSLPADSSTVFNVPIAQCDGSNIEQFHTGLLLWPEAGGSGSVAWGDVTGKPSTFAPVIGTGATDAAAGDHTHTEPLSVVAMDDFMGSLIASGSIGQLGWRHYAVGGTGSAIGRTPSATPPYIGVRSLKCGNAVNAGQVIYQEAHDNLLAVTNWQFCFVFKLIETTDCDTIIGFTATTDLFGIGKYGGTSFGLRYSSAADTNFMFFSKNTNSDWAADDANNYSLSTGVAADTAWHKIRMRSSTAGTVEMSLDGGAWTAVTMVTTSGNWLPIFYVAARTTTSKQIYVDYYSFQQAGSR